MAQASGALALRLFLTILQVGNASKDMWIAELFSYGSPFGLGLPVTQAELLDQGYLFVQAITAAC